MRHVEDAGGHAGALGAAIFRNEYHPKIKYVKGDSKGHAMSNNYTKISPQGAAMQAPRALRRLRFVLRLISSQAVKRIHVVQIAAYTKKTRTTYIYIYIYVYIYIYIYTYYISYKDVHIR